MNSVYLGHRRKSLEVVDVVRLGEASSHKARLETRKGTISMMLLCVNPLAANDMLAGRKWHNVPSMALEQSVHLIVHRRLPTRRSDGISKAAWDGVQINARQEKLVRGTQPLEGHVVGERI